MPKGPLVFQSDVIWFPSEIRRLLRAIEKHPGLFDPRNEAFGIREKNNIMWGAVAKLVGGNKTDIQCRDKWTCLRGTYRRHVRTELTNSVRRRSNWPWVEEMSFMRNYILDKEEMAEAQLLGKKVKSSTRTRSSDGGECESKSTEQKTTATLVTKHQPNCPKNSVIMTTSNAPATSTTGSLPFTGIIYNGVGLRLPNLVGAKGVQMSLLPPGQPNMRMRLVQPSLLRTNQGTLRFVTASQGSNGVAIVQPSKPTCVTTTVTKPADPISGDALQVDLAKVKPDPDTLDNTEFIDMNTMIKKEPMDTDGDEEDHEQFNFLPEDPSGISDIASTEDNEQTSQDGSQKPDSERSNQSSPKLNERTSPKPSDDSVDDSNQLFMSSVLTNMRKLTPYDQSMFRLKVLQILHEMMFPTK